MAKLQAMARHRFPYRDFNIIPKPGVVCFVDIGFLVCHTIRAQDQERPSGRVVCGSADHLGVIGEQKVQNFFPRSDRRWIILSETAHENPQLFLHLPMSDRSKLSEKPFGFA